MIDKKIIIYITLCFSIFLVGDRVDAASISKKEIELYQISDSYKQYLTMPTSYKSEEQIVVSGATTTPTYRIKSGETITVDSTGLVKFVPEVKWCKTEGIWRTCSSTEKDGYTKYETYREGTNVVEVTIGTEKLEVTVNTNLYERYNAEKIMTDYVKNNITSSMTEKQKMEKIMERIAQTKYSIYSSDYVGLFSGDGADCWGDTAAMVYMGKLAGLKIHSRDARRDAGAGSGHMNAAALLDGEVYVVDVMSTTTIPRKTEIKKTNQGFSTAYKTGEGTYFLQYDGYDEIVSIPETTSITKIGDYAFDYGSHGETKVTTINIPKTLLTVGVGSFQKIKTLHTINVASDNPNFKSISGNLYSKDGTILYAYPSGKTATAFQVPSGVATIKTSAFTDAESLKIITLPESVTTVEDNAFNGGYLVVKNRNASLGKGLCSITRPIYGYKGSTAESYASSNNCQFFEITADTMKDISTLSVDIPAIEYNHDGNIPNVIIKDGNYTLQQDVDFTVICSNNSYANSQATIKIYGKGKYAGFIETHYKINKRKIRYTYLNPVVDYNGSIQSPIFQLEEAEYLTLYYGNNSTSGLSTSLREYTNPGTYKFGVRIEGSGYESVYLNDQIFTIRGKDITKAKIEGIRNYPYLTTGSYVTPMITVTYDGNVLVKNTDYRMSVSDYWGPGVVKLTITGIGIYEGTIEKTYQIIKNTDYTLKVNKGSVSLPLKSTTTLSLSATPDVYVNPSLVTWKSSDSSVVTVDSNGVLTPKKLGTATITGTFNRQSVTSKVTVTNYLKGDVNTDGKVTIKDAMEIIYFYTKKKTPTDDAFTIGDMNNDNKLTMKDANQIIAIYLKK